MDEENCNMQSAPVPHQPDEVLTQLAHEAAEHQRVWGIVSGLTEQLVLKQREVELLDSMLAWRTTPSDLLEEKNERIHQLEQKIVKQRTALKNLEECRLFERDTEQLLTAALHEVINGGPLTKGAEVARKALEVHAERKGPRSQETDAS